MNGKPQSGAGSRYGNMLNGMASSLITNRCLVLRPVCRQQVASTTYTEDIKEDDTSTA